ncbi:MAG: ParB N-terminal domain-containing protein [Akkermansiaceae bacterium]|nr:ParB N-terminal domain-containing protein [Akkermansiaceae bacterium]
MSIPVHCAHTRLVDPNTLKPNPVNPNRHSAHQIQLLASIIQEQGWRNPVTVSNRSGLIVRGHGRLEAALLIGCETIPVDEQDYASEAEELADLLADNRLSELAELDDDDLRRVLKSIADADPDFDIELTGFMEDEIRKLMDDADNPEDEIETIPKMECQAFEHHDYLVFMFHDLRDWMQILQLMGAREVDYSITRRKLLNTKRGYSFPAVSSAMQKAVRRGDAKLAGYWALELWASGFGQYVWRRLLTVSAEDCWGILTQEVKALHDSYTEINQHTPAKKPKGRIFISKAVILLCLAKKNRDADHLQNFVYDQQAGLEPETLIDELEAAGQYVPIPDYAYDCHTPQGRRMGKTKAEFFRAEQDALTPFIPGLFDDLIDS